MNTIHFDSPFTDNIRREQLYNGQLFVFSPRPSSLALCEFAERSGLKFDLLKNAAVALLERRLLKECPEQCPQLTAARAENR